MNGRTILVLNTGSSSLKAVLYRDGKAVLDTQLNNPNPEELISELTKWVHVNTKTDTVDAIGHRIVHGGAIFSHATIIDSDVHRQLESIAPLDPDHMPNALRIIDVLSGLFQDVPQVACFDTAFYRDLPRVAQILPIPRKFEDKGIRRYGFHGLSYTYLLEKLSEECGEAAANGRVIFAHLGSGASLTATNQSKPVDTTMGLTPASGIPMSTRSGNIDPGLFLQLHTLANLDYAQINSMLNKESGLLGVSESSADMYQLLENQSSDPRAAEAVELFCYEVKKTIGAFAAALGGIDTIVFSGGMGENAPRIRERVLRGTEFLGVEIHNERNYAGDLCISTDTSRVGVHVFHTDESSIIFRQVLEIIQSQVNN